MPVAQLRKQETAPVADIGIIMAELVAMIAQRQWFRHIVGQRLEPTEMRKPLFVAQAIKPTVAAHRSLRNRNIVCGKISCLNRIADFCTKGGDFRIGAVGGRQDFDLHDVRSGRCVRERQVWRRFVSCICIAVSIWAGKEARAVRLMNHFGDQAEHVVLSAVPMLMARATRSTRRSRSRFPVRTRRRLPVWPAMGRYRKLAAYMKKFHLVLSYNWGAMDGVMAHTLL